METKFTDILDKMILSAKDIDISNYVFCCAKNLNFGLNKYKEFNVYYFNFVKEDNIYLMQSPFYNGKET